MPNAIFDFQRVNTRLPTLFFSEFRVTPDAPAWIYQAAEIREFEIIRFRLKIFEYEFRCTLYASEMPMIRCF